MSKSFEIFLIFYILVIVSALVTPKLLWNTDNGSKCESDFPLSYPASNPSYVIETDGVKVYAWKHGQPFYEGFDFGEVLEKTVNDSNIEGGGLIYIKAGCYWVKWRHTFIGNSSHITYNVGVLIYKPRNIIIAGEGNRTVIQASENTTNVMWIYNAVNFTLCNLVVDGNKQAQYLWGQDRYAAILTEGGCANMVFKDLLIRNCKYCGLFICNSDVLGEVSGLEWLCPSANVTIYNVKTCGNDAFAIMLDAVHNGKAFNCTSQNDYYAVGFCGLEWDWWNISQTFENITIINPVYGILWGWHPEGKLKNLYIYLSRPQKGYLFDFTNATRIEVENVYIYAKINIERLIYTNNDNVIFKGDFTILIKG